MPVTRQEKKIRGLSTEQSPSDSTATSATEASLATGSTTTAGTELTASTAPDTSATSAPSAVSQASVAAPPATPSIASTMPADVTRLRPPAAREVPGRTRNIDASTVKMKRTVTSQEPKTTPQPRAPSKKGGGGESTSSFDIKLALAKEKWLRLQVELAATQYAILEAQGAVPEEELEDADSVHSATEVNERVDNWLETQEQRPLLAIAGAPHVNPIEAPTVNNAGPQNVPEHQQAPAGAQSMEAQSGMAALTEAITRAVMAARTPKFVELPVFNGSHHEWLPFRAAYYETESSFTLVENINRLRRNLKGKAKEAVEMLLITSAPPSDIMNTLESRFGRPEAIAAMEIETLRSLPRLTDSPRDICIFASRISNVVATLKVLGCESYMHHPDISNSIVDKFTPWMRFRYYDFTANLPDEEPALLKLEKYLKKEVTVCGKHAKPEQVTPPAPTIPPKRSQKINTVIEKTYKYKCPVCSEEHSSTECEQFKKMEINTRWETAKSKRMCFRCLRYRGANHRCRSKVCGINSCKSYHNEMLHHEKATEKQKDEDTEVINSAWTIKKKQSYLKIIPVRVEGPRGAINTFALLDDGSTVTLIDNSVAESIGAKGRIDPLRIETINDMKTAQLASRRVSFKLRGLNHHEEHIQARTVRNLQVASQKVSREMVDGCEHLADIREYLSYEEVKPQILIGQDNWHLLVTSAVRRGNRTQPVASLTPLGWVLHGSQTRTCGCSTDFVSHVTERNEDLEDLAKQYCERDGLCIQEKEPPDDKKELYKAEEKTERVLGVIWDLDEDELTFNLNLARIAPTNGGKAPTKMEASRIVMTLFDPLGFASPVTTKAKQLLQEVWRRGTSWDEEIDGDVSLSLVVAKAKVAPLKLTSIPRLELQAAVLGTRLAETVINEHERPPDTKVFWTDSKTALAWIRTGPRSYKPYVAHRLAAIEEASKVNEWRWVPTKLNVADDATRDVPAAFDRHHRWYKGPDFLYQTEEHWPIETSKTEKIEPSGEERVHHVHSKKKPRLAEALPDVSRFSSWDRLRYATGRVLQFIELSRIGKESVNYRKTRKNTEADPSWKKTSRPASKKQNTVQQITSPNKKYLPASAELLKKAEMLLMRSSQEESFAEEIEDLKNSKAIQKESRLHQLSIEHVDNTIRLRSRIRATTDVPDDFKSPIVLDGDHPTVRLWIEAIHRRMHHAGVEATVNECRQQYWVLRLRPVTRMIIRRCLFCRMKTQAPPYPRTGDLPACRLAHHKRPFTYTGLDYFGPLSVAVGRTRQKRYVAIFTCLTMRAIHLEIAGSLSTDSAIMALRRMMARRGCPTEIWSDNGTNLKGADKELRRAIDDATAEEAAKKTISWRYIPPGAPFMGGAWERMVRSVKTALTATLHERHPTEEVLSTLLAEVEYTVNSRPLTHVSVSPDDPEALTPNHFLLGGPGRVPLPGTFDERDAISKSSWRSAQRLADMFWTRWVKEYLPELQHRREPHGRGPAVAVGDLVQIVDANLPRNVWIRGRVIATYPGPDGVVRAVDIRTKGGVLRRPVRKLVILPLDDVPAPTDSSTSSNGGRDVRDDLLVST